MQDEPLSPGTRATIDRLIPPPWNAWKRRIAGLVTALVLLGVGLLWTGGWLSPNLEFQGGQYGGDGPVTMGLVIQNNGARTIRVLSIDETPGTNQIAATLADRPLPAELDPGNAALLLATYEVVDCESIGRGDPTWGIEVEFADGPFTMRRHLDVDASFFVADWRDPGTADVVWARAMTQYVCP